MTGFVVLKSLVRQLFGHARAVRTNAVTLAAAALLGTAFAQPAHAAQDEQTLNEALATSERVPVIVIFDLPEFEADGLDGPAFDAAADARIARQREVIERALGVSSATLSAPAAQGSPLRREYRSVAMVSMYLSEDEIDALLADPSVADIQLDRPVPPLSNGTIPLIGANTLHSAGLTGAGSTIAILDTGVDHEHPMFSGRILESACFSSTVSGEATSLCPAGAASDTTTADAGDDCAYTGDTGTVIAGCGHGTHVAGIAAGASFVDTGTGDTLIGVAPGANIVAVQVFSNFTAYCAGFGLAVPCALSYTSDQIAALDWLYTNRATLGLTSINMSLGGGNNTTFCNADSRYTVINNLRTAGVATAIASGNSGYDNAVGAPGCIEPAITVGATDDSDVVASFSNSATMVDMLAPGVSVNSAEPTINDTLPGRARSISGTSMATPHVAGAFALLRAANPSATVQDIETALENTGLSVTESPSGLVRPRIRVNLAHAALDTTAPTVTISGPAGPINGAFTATFTFSESVTGFEITDIVMHNASRSNFAGSGTTYTATITPNGEGFVQLGVNAASATDAAGNGNTAATVYSVYADVTAPGVMISGPSGLVTAAFTATFTFTENVTGFTSGDVVAGNASVTSFSGSGTTYTATITPSSNGTVTVDVAGSVATDTAGNNNTAATQYSVTYAIPPRVSQIIRDTPDVSPTNADTLTWAISFNTGVTNVSADDFMISGTTATLGVVQDHAQSYRVTASGGDLASVNGTVTLGFAPGQNIQSTAGAALVDTSVTGANQPSYVLDNTAPTVAISGPAGPVQGAFTATITFSEPVSGFASNEVTLTNATLGSFSGSGTTYTTNISPSGDGTVAINVASGVATDSVGNGNTAATQYSVTADATAPLIASIERQTPATSLTNANSVTWRIVFAEAMLNVDVSDFTASGTTATVTNVTNSSGNIWDVTVSGGDLAGLNGTITLGFAGGQNITDAAGNALTNTTPYGIFQNTYVIDNTAPTLTAFARNTPAVEKTNADTLVFDITFNEAVTNVSADDFTITGTTATGVLAGSGSAYTLTLSGGDLASYNGIVGLNLAAGQDITDTAGNVLGAGEPGTDQTYDVRNTAPALASITRSTPATSPTSSNSLVWDFAFSAIDDSFTLPANAFTVSGTTATVTNVSRYSIGLLVTVSGGDLANLDGDVTLGLANTDFADDYGNVMNRTIPAGAQLTYTLDNAAPTVTTTGPAGPVNAAFTATFTFSEPVTGFVMGDITVGNGTASNFSGSGTTYTATITPTADGAVTVNVAQGVAADAAGNGNTAATQFSVTNDQTAPVMFHFFRLTPVSAITNADSLAFRAAFSEHVNNVTADDFVVTGSTATITSISAQSCCGFIGGAVYDVQVSGGDLASFNGVVGLDVAAGQNIVDVAGNAFAGAEPSNDETFTLDNTAPSGHTVTINPAPINAANQTAISVNFAGFEPGGTLTYTVTSDGGPGSLTGGFAVPLANGSFPPQDASAVPDGLTTLTVIHVDAVGNAAPAITATALKDTVAPTLLEFTRLAPGDAVTAEDSLQFQAVFSENVSNVSIEDFVVTGTTATVTSISSPPPPSPGPSGGDLSSPSTANFLYIIHVSGGDLASYNGVVGLDVAAGQNIVDVAGNAFAGAEPPTDHTFTLDNTAPTLAITGATGPVNAAFTATFTFSEAVSGFAVGDISVGNGTASNFQATSATVYSATITPTADGAVTVDVASAAATDTAGNGNTAATQFSVTADVTAPRVASIVRQVPSTVSTNADSLVWRVTFSEGVSGVDTADFSVSGTTATVSGVTNPSGNTFDVTVSGGDLASLNGTATIAFAGGQNIADSVGNALTNTTPTGTSETSYTLDNTAPTLAITGPSGLVSGAFTATFTFSEAVTGFEPGDMAVSNGAASGLSGSGAVYTATIAPAADGLVTVSSGAGAATDAAGNINTAATPLSVTNDQTAPTVTIAGPAGPVGAPFEVTVSFSEPVTGFALGDIAVGNGSASNLTGSDASYTATITAAADGAVTVDVAQGVANDAAGNGNAAATRFSVVRNTVPQTLTVSRVGVGSGRVTSNAAGIDCGSDCEEGYAIGTSVTLTATADTGSSFASWTDGPCTGSTNSTCAVTMSANQAVSARFTLDTPPAGRIVASTLPAARSGHVGGPVISTFLSVVSRASTPAQSCSISAPAGAPVTLSYRQVDAGNAAIGGENPVFDIPNGATLSFVMGMTPVTQTGPAGYSFAPVITCENASLDPIVGVNSVFLTIGAAPAPDLLSISATPSGDGVIRIPASGRVQFMTAAVVNIGVGDGSAGANEVTLTTTVDTGSAVLPLSLEICQINAASICITPRGPSVTSVMPANTPLFFAVFVRDTSGGAGIAFDPANARVHLRFADATGTTRSVTSAAVTAPAAADLPVASAVPSGRWSVLMRRSDGGWPGLVRTSVHVAGNGVAIVDDGVQPRLAVFDPALDGSTGSVAPGQFRLAGTDGRWTSDGLIRLGGAWATTPGEFWGVRDARTDSDVQWRDLAGAYGGSVHISATGEIRGIAGGCAVYGQTAGAASSVTLLSLTGCAMSGSYAAVIDLPANDNEAPVLVIAGQSAGWRLVQ